MPRRVNVARTIERNVFRPKPYYRSTRRRTVARKANMALVKVNRLNRMIETKHLDRDSGAASVLDTGTSLIALDVVTTGDGDIQREGSRISPIGLKVNYTIKFNVNDTVPQMVRVICFQGKSRLVASLPWDLDTDILDLAAVTNADIPQANYLWNMHYKCRILYDKTHLVFDTGGMHQQICKTFKIGAKRLHQIRFAEGNTDGSETEYGNIMIFAISNKATSNGPTWFFTSRLTFKDA